MRKKWRQLKKFLRQADSIIKTIFGMPDYERYLKHWFQNHNIPGTFPMSEKEYYLYALKNRYEKGGTTRCC